MRVSSKIARGALPLFTIRVLRERLSGDLRRFVGCVLLGGGGQSAPQGGGQEQEGLDIGDVLKAGMTPL